MHQGRCKGGKGESHSMLGGNVLLLTSHGSIQVTKENCLSFFALGTEAIDRCC